MHVTWTGIWWSEYYDTGVIRVYVFTDADACLDARGLYQHR